MKKYDYTVFFESEENKRILDGAIRYFTAGAINRKLADKIEAIGIKVMPKLGSGISNRSYMYAHFPSKEMCIHYLFEEERIGGFQGWVLDACVELMVDKFLLIEEKLIFHNSNIQEYAINGQWVKYLHDNELIYNCLFGYKYFLSNVRKSVFKIEVRSNDGTYSIGTGWIINSTSTSDENSESIIVTNEHVINGAAQIKVYDVHDEEFEIIETSSLDGIDVAFIVIKSKRLLRKLVIYPKIEVLDEIITVGYPSIPTTKEAYQVTHRGEISADVSDYWGNKYLTISARTSAGNSGSPVLDSLGRVIGMVTRELFEKQSFSEKGVFPYYACIPMSEILDKWSKQIK